MSRVLPAAAAGAAVLAGGCAAVQAAADARDRRRFPPPGRLVDIGGRRLHLIEAGSGGLPLVIIPAMADPALTWAGILPALAGSRQVIAYDRAGIGWSDPPARRPQGFDEIADDLRALVSAAGISKPFLLAGHSLGGPMARRFAVRHPRCVAGLLLIDSSHEAQGARLGAVEPDASSRSMVRLAAKRRLMPLGAYRLGAGLGLASQLDRDAARETPPDLVAADRAVWLSSRQRRAAVAEMLLSARMRGTPPDLGALPLTVLTAGEMPGRGQQEWRRLQQELAALSSDSKQVIAEGAGHYIHLDDPGVVVRVVAELAGRAERAGRLTERAPGGRAFPGMPE